MAQLLGHSITYRIAVDSRTGRKVFALQTLPACVPDEFADTVGKVSAQVVRGQYTYYLGMQIQRLKVIGWTSPESTDTRIL